MKLKDIEKVIVFDTETTGVDVYNDRIVSAFIGVYTRGGDLVGETSYLINPGIPIPDGAIAVHGITNEMAAKGAHPQSVDGGIAGLADDLQALLDQGLPLVAYNGAFDFTLLQEELKRHELEPMRWGTAIIDPYVIDKAVAKYVKGSRKLVATAARYKVEVLENAHEARADCIMAGGVAFKVLEAFMAQHKANPDMDTAQFYKRQQFWAGNQAKSLQDYFRRTDPTRVVDGAWPIR